ncbi:FkbM family methyltransferase [Streptomyces violascens]|uniref:FkbM family methyltransferase n=1 Tax=Streptomyces violascens TaxID=67381 RepID=UPI0036ACEFF5
MTVIGYLRRTRGTLRLPRALQLQIRSATLRGLVPRQLWRRLHPTGTWILHDPAGRPFRYYSHDDDVMARSIVWTDLRDWEETTQPVLFELARKARGFLDIGAFSGIYTLLACQANPALRAIAVEPNPRSVVMLRRNVELNDLDERVTVVDRALSDAPGRGRLAIPCDSTAARLQTLASPLPRDRAVSHLTVDVTTADELARSLPIDLVKIDVEGMEPEVLQGMRDLISRNRPAVIAECLDASALNRLRVTAAGLGYQTVQHIGPTGLSPAPEGFSPPPYYANFFLTQ